MRIEPRRILIVDHDSLLDAVPEDLKEQADFLSDRLIGKAIDTFKSNQLIVVTQSECKLALVLDANIISYYPEITDEWPTAVLSGAGSPGLDYQFERVKVFFRPNDSFSDLMTLDHEKISKEWADAPELIPQMLGMEQALLANDGGTRSTAVSLMKRVLAGKNIKIKKQIAAIDSEPATLDIRKIPFKRIEFQNTILCESGLGIVFPVIERLEEYQSKQDGLEFLTFTPREQAFREFMSGCGKEVAVDTETTGLNIQHWGDDKTIGVSLAYHENAGAYIPISGPQTTIEDILADPTVEKIFHNAKFDLAAVKKLPGYTTVAGPIRDTMVAAYLLGFGADDDDRALFRQRKPLGLKSLAKSLLGYQMTLIDDLKDRSGKLELESTAIGQLAPYAAADAIMTLRLWHKLKQMLIEQNLWDIFELEMHVLQYLLEMEEDGVYIDITGIKDAERQAEQDLEQMKENVYDIIGNKDFDIDSPTQLSRILFEQLGLQPIKSTKTGFSVDKETLNKLEGKHPIIEKLQEYKELRTVLNTYLVQLPKHIASDGRFHTQYRQTKVVTGRFASTPNLLAIPARGPGKIIRSLFVPQYHQWKYVGADFSQLEIRIMAHYSQDPKLLAVYEAEARGEEVDIYKVVAAEIYGVSQKEIDDTMRGRAKILTLGTNYGLTEYGFSRRSGMSQDEAKEFQRQYFDRFPGIKDYMQEMKEYAYKNMEVRSIMGRRRFLPDIKSDIMRVRLEAERHAINFPIQASGADIAKLSMHLFMSSRDIMSLRDKCMLVLHVHDEFMIETHPDAIDDVSYLLQEAMEGSGKQLGLSVPLKADVHTGNSWAEAKGK